MTKSTDRTTRNHTTPLPTPTPTPITTQEVVTAMSKILVPLLWSKQNASKQRLFDHDIE